MRSTEGTTGSVVLSVAYLFVAWGKTRKNEKTLKMFLPRPPLLEFLEFIEFLLPRPRGLAFYCCNYCCCFLCVWLMGLSYFVSVFPGILWDGGSANWVYIPAFPYCQPLFLFVCGFQHLFVFVKGEIFDEGGGFFLKRNRKHCPDSGRYCRGLLFILRYEKW